MIRTSLSIPRPTFSKAPIKQHVRPDLSSARWESTLHYLTWSLIGFGVRRQHQLSLEGLENFPQCGPSVIVANHGSHLDTLLLGSAIPRAVRSKFSPLAAGDTFFRNQSQSWLSSRFLNLRPLWRNQRNPHGLMKFRRDLEADEQCLLIYPEGTRSRTGAMGRFKPGVGMLVAGSSIPVIPCHISGTLDAWPSNRKLPRAGSLRLKVGKPISFESCQKNSDSWRSIARTLESAVKSLAPADAS